MYKRKRQKHRDEKAICFPLFTFHFEFCLWNNVLRVLTSCWSDLVMVQIAGQGPPAVPQSKKLSKLPNSGWSWWLDWQWLVWKVRLWLGLPSRYGVTATSTPACLAVIWKYKPFLSYPYGYGFHLERDVGCDQQSPCSRAPPPIHTHTQRLFTPKIPRR